MGIFGQQAGTTHTFIAFKHSILAQWAEAINALDDAVFQSGVCIIRLDRDLYPYYHRYVVGRKFFESNCYTDMGALYNKADVQAQVRSILRRHKHANLFMASVAGMIAASIIDEIELHHVAGIVDTTPAPFWWALAQKLCVNIDNKTFELVRNTLPTELLDVATLTAVFEGRYRMPDASLALPTDIV